MLKVVMTRKPIENPGTFLFSLLYINIECDGFLHREWAEEPTKIRAFCKNILKEPGSQQEKLLADKLTF